MAQPAAVRTAGTLRAVHQPAGDSPLTATTVPPSDAPGRRERRRRRKPGRRGWLLPVSASAAAVLLATAGVVAAIALGQDQAPMQAAPTPTIVSTPTTLSVPTASPTRSAKTRRSAVRPNARSTPPRAKRAIPPGYVLRSALGARLAVPSHYIAKPDGTCHILWEPPGKQDEQIIVCSQESRDAPKGAAARASFWAGRFKSNPILHDVQVTIADVKVNGRAAKALTVIFRGDDGRIWRKQEMYYSGPEGEWKIIIDYEVSTYSERVNQSLFLTAIRTFRV
jgi:hypothetical protein